MQGDRRYKGPEDEKLSSGQYGGRWVERSSETTSGKTCGQVRKWALTTE
jgi:hypothetical protein